jgi:hypothetical protein
MKRDKANLKAAEHRRSLEAGFDHHMVKPINFAQLTKRFSDQ